MADRILYKVAYNGVNGADSIRDRDSLAQRNHAVRSTFLDINGLVKSGRDLQADLEKNGIKNAPREFVNLD